MVGNRRKGGKTVPEKPIWGNVCEKCRHFFFFSLDSNSRLIQRRDLLDHGLFLFFFFFSVFLAKLFTIYFPILFYFFLLRPFLISVFFLPVLSLIKRHFYVLVFFCFCFFSTFESKVKECRHCVNFIIFKFRQLGGPSC